VCGLGVMYCLTTGNCRTGGSGAWELCMTGVNATSVPSAPAWVTAAVSAVSRPRSSAPCGREAQMLRPRGRPAQPLHRVDHARDRISLGTRGALSRGTERRIPW